MPRWCCKALNYIWSYSLLTSPAPCLLSGNTGRQLVSLPNLVQRGQAVPTPRGASTTRRSKALKEDSNCIATIFLAISEVWVKKTQKFSFAVVDKQQHFLSLMNPRERENAREFCCCFKNMLPTWVPVREASCKACLDGWEQNAVYNKKSSFSFNADELSNRQYCK